MEEVLLPQIIIQLPEDFSGSFSTFEFGWIRFQYDSDTKQLRADLSNLSEHANYELALAGVITVCAKNKNLTLTAADFSLLDMDSALKNRLEEIIKTTLATVYKKEEAKPNLINREYAEQPPRLIVYQKTPDRNQKINKDMGGLELTYEDESTYWDIPNAITRTELFSIMSKFNLALNVRPVLINAENLSLQNRKVLAEFYPELSSSSPESSVDSEPQVESAPKPSMWKLFWSDIRESVRRRPLQYTSVNRIEEKETFSGKTVLPDDIESFTIHYDGNYQLLFITINGQNYKKERNFLRTTYTHPDFYHFLENDRTVTLDLPPTRTLSAAFKEAERHLATAKKNNSSKGFQEIPLQPAPISQSPDYDKVTITFRNLTLTEAQLEQLGFEKAADNKNIFTLYDHTTKVRYSYNRREKQLTIHASYHTFNQAFRNTHDVLKSKFGIKFNPKDVTTEGQRIGKAERHIVKTWISPKFQTHTTSLRKLFSRPHHKKNREGDSDEELLNLKESEDTHSSNSNNSTDDIPTLSQDQERKYLEPVARPKKSKLGKLFVQKPSRKPEEGLELKEKESLPQQYQKRTILLENIKGNPITFSELTAFAHRHNFKIAKNPHHTIFTLTHNQENITLEIDDEQHTLRYDIRYPEDKNIESLETLADTVLHKLMENFQLTSEKKKVPLPTERPARFAQVFPEFTTTEELEELIRELPHLFVTYGHHFSEEKSHPLLPEALKRANELKEKVSLLPEDYVAGTDDYFARLQKVLEPRFLGGLIPDPNNEPPVMSVYYMLEDPTKPEEITALAILLSGIPFITKLNIKYGAQPLTQLDLDSFSNSEIKYVPTERIGELSQLLSSAIQEHLQENIHAKRIAGEKRQAEAEYEKLPDEKEQAPTVPATLPQKSPPEVATKNKLEPNTTIYFNNDFPPKVAFVRIDNQWYKNNPVPPARIILEQYPAKPDDVVLDFYRSKTCFIDPTETWNESLDTKVTLALGFPPRVRAGAQERAQFRFNIDKPGVREAINKAQAGNSKEDDTGFRLGDGRYRLIHNETRAEMRVLSDGRCLSSFIQTKKDNFDDTVNALLNIYEAQIRMGRAMAEHHYAETGEKLNLGVTTLFLVEERKRDGKPYTKEEKAQTEKLLAALDKGVRAILAKPENDIVKNAYKLEFEFEKVRYQRVHKKTDNYPLKFKAPEKKAEARMQAVPKRRGPGGTAQA